MTLYLLFIISSYTRYRKKRKETTIKTQKATQTEQQIDYKVRLDAKYKMRLSNSESNYDVRLQNYGVINFVPFFLDHPVYNTANNMQ